MRADCDSYFVTMYIQIGTTWKKKDKKNKKEEKIKKQR